jgi:predicted nuclease with TOPRIM domain
MGTSAAIDVSDETQVQHAQHEVMAMTLPSLDKHKKIRSTPRGAAEAMPSVRGGQTARLQREEPPMHRREEEICRGIYKKHASQFFDEMKEAFAKETLELRKQADRAIRKVTTAWGMEGPSDVPSQVTDLRNQIADIHRALAIMNQQGFSSTGSAAIVATTAEPEEMQGPTREQLLHEQEVLHSTLGAMNERVTKQQDELRSISQFLKRELTGAKKAALTPVWKEKALQDIAQGELRTVCVEEVGRIFKEFTEDFKEDHLKPVVRDIFSAEMSSQNLEIRHQIQEVRHSLAADNRDIARRVEHQVSQQMLLGQRADGLEERQRQGVWALEQLAEELRGAVSAEVGELRGQCAALGTRCSGIELRCDGLDARFEGLSARNDGFDIRCGALHTSLADEAGSRAKDIAHLSAELASVGARAEEHRAAQAQLLQQLAQSASSAEEAQRRFWDLQRRRDDEVRDRHAQLGRMLQDTQAELDDLRGKIKVVEKSKAALTDDCRDIADAIQRSNVALGSLSSKVEDTRMSIATLQRRCDEANSESEEARSAFNMALGRVGAVEQHAQELGRVCAGLDDRLATFGTSKEPNRADQEPTTLDSGPPSLQGAVEDHARQLSQLRSELSTLRASADERARALAVERDLQCRIDKVVASEEGQAKRVEELERAVHTVREDLRVPPGDTINSSV